jgi:hypothetical protein
MRVITAVFLLIMAGAFTAEWTVMAPSVSHDDTGEE